MIDLSLNVVSVLTNLPSFHTQVLLCWKLMSSFPPRQTLIWTTDWFYIRTTLSTLSIGWKKKHPQNGEGCLLHTKPQIFRIDWLNETHASTPKADPPPSPTRHRQQKALHECDVPLGIRSVLLLTWSHVPWRMFAAVSATSLMKDASALSLSE